VSSPEPARVTFYQLSVGLRIMLVCIFIGSCAGASSNRVTDQDATGEDVQQLNTEIQNLEREVRRLRADVKRRP
jgi:outer membrane murein-binding lipoprotein Lpp